MGKYRAMGAAIAALGLGAVLIQTAAADTDVVFTMSDERIQRASGLAADRDRGLYWTVNSGPESDRALAMRPDGTVEGTVRFGEFLTDPQAVYYIGSRLYIADIGDAGEERESIAVHRYTEPDPVGAQPEVIRTFELFYDDGQARDARAMLVGDSGQLFVITHAEEGEIWATDDAPTGSAPNRLTRVGDMPGWVTDALFLPDGRIVTRSYTSVEVIDPGTYEVVARTAAPYQEQGEAMSLSLDRTTLLLASTGTNQDVLQLGIPTSMADVPDPVPSPPASPEPTPTSEPVPEEPVEESDETIAVNENAGGARTGTTFAIVAAAVLAVGSGLVVYFSGSRQPAPQPTRRPRRAAAAPPDPEFAPEPEPEPALLAASELAPQQPDGHGPGPEQPDPQAFEPHPPDPHASEPQQPEPHEPEPAVSLPMPVPPPEVAPAPVPMVTPEPARAQSLISAGEDPFARPAPEPAPAARPSITISEDLGGPVRARRAYDRPRPIEPDYGFDEHGTWVRSTRTAEEAAEDLRWLNRE